MVSRSTLARIAVGILLGAVLGVVLHESNTRQIPAKFTACVAAGCPVSIALTSSKNPSQVGEAVVFTATVGGGVGTLGHVFLTVDDVVIESLPSEAVGAYSFSQINTLAAGNHQVTATYAAGDGFVPVSAMLTQVVMSQGCTGTYTSIQDCRVACEPVQYCCTGEGSNGGCEQFFPGLTTCQGLDDPVTGEFKKYSSPTCNGECAVASSAPANPQWCCQYRLPPGPQNCKPL